MFIGIGVGVGLGDKKSGVDLGAAVEAILAGTAGFARDPIAANLFQDAAPGVTPVVIAADPIARINCQWGNAPPNWQQATAGQRPAWDGTGIACDGVDDYMATFSNPAFLNNVPGTFYCEKVTPTDLAAIRPLVSFSQGTGSTLQRFVGFINTNGSIGLQLRRLDLDTVTAITTVAGLVTAGVPAVISFQADWAGTGFGKIWLNGAEVQSQLITGSVGNTEATDSVRIRALAGLGAVPPSQDFFGPAGRSVMTPYALASGRSDVEAWVGAA